MLMSVKVNPLASNMKLIGFFCFPKLPCRFSHLNSWFSFQQRFAIKAVVLLNVDFKDYSFIYLMYCPKLLMQSNAI